MSSPANWFNIPWFCERRLKPTHIFFKTTLFPFLLCASDQIPLLRFHAHQPLAAISSGSPFTPFFPPLPSSPLSLRCASPLPPVWMLWTLLLPSPWPLLMKLRSARGHFSLYQYSMPITRVGLLTLTQGTMLHRLALVLSCTHTHTHKNVQLSRAYGLFNLHTMTDVGLCVHMNSPEDSFATTCV